MMIMMFRNPFGLYFETKVVFDERGLLMGF